MAVAGLLVALICTVVVVDVLIENAGRLTTLSIGQQLVRDRPVGGIFLGGVAVGLLYALSLAGGLGWFTRRRRRHRGSP